MAGLVLGAPLARAATAAPRVRAVGGLLTAAGSLPEPGHKFPSSRRLCPCASGAGVRRRHGALQHSATGRFSIMHDVIVWAVEVITLDIVVLPLRQDATVVCPYRASRLRGILYPTAWPRGVFV